MDITSINTDGFGGERKDLPLPAGRDLAEYLFDVAVRRTERREPPEPRPRPGCILANRRAVETNSRNRYRTGRLRLAFGSRRTQAALQFRSPGTRRIALPIRSTKLSQ